MKKRRNRRLGKLLGLPVLAVCGFAIAATLASVGLADITTTEHVDELDVDVHVDELDHDLDDHDHPGRRGGLHARVLEEQRR